MVSFFFCRTNRGTVVSDLRTIKWCTRWTTSHMSWDETFKITGTFFGRVVFATIIPGVVFIRTTGVTDVSGLSGWKQHGYCCNNHEAYHGRRRVHGHRLMYWGRCNLYVTFGNRAKSKKIRDRQRLLVLFVGSKINIPIECLRISRFCVDRK